MAIFHLARTGYGSVKELRECDTPEFLDMLEAENIRFDLEQYHMEQAENKRK